MHIADSLCCTVESNTTVSNKNFKIKNNLKYKFFLKRSLLSWKRALSNCTGEPVSRCSREYGRIELNCPQI